LTLVQEANILRVSLIMRLARSARSRFAGQRLPYHQNARTRRARGDRGKCRTNSSLRENCHCSIGAKSRNWRKNLQSRKVKNTRHVRYSVRGGEGGIRTPDTVTRMPHFECGAFNHSATSPNHYINGGFRFARRDKTADGRQNGHQPIYSPRPVTTSRNAASSFAAASL